MRAMRDSGDSEADIGEHYEGVGDVDETVEEAVIAAAPAVAPAHGERTVHACEKKTTLVFVQSVLIKTHSAESFSRR